MNVPRPVHDLLASNAYSGKLTCKYVVSNNNMLTVVACLLASTAVALSPISTYIGTVHNDMHGVHVAKGCKRYFCMPLPVNDVILLFNRQRLCAVQRNSKRKKTRRH